MTELILTTPNQLSEMIKKSVQDALEGDRKEKDSDKLLDAKELCEFLGIHLSTLNKWKSESKIPFKRMGKRIFFKKEEVLAALEDSNYSKMKELKL